MEVLARLLQVTGAAGLFGALILKPPSDAAAVRAGDLGRWISRTAIAGALCLTLGAFLDLWRLAAALVLDPSGSPVGAVAAVVSATSIGQLLVTRWGLGLALAASIARGWRGRASALGYVLAAAFALSLGAGGHAQTTSHPWLVVPVQALHTATAAGWFGGLALLAMLSGTSMAAADLARAVGRFSRFGLLAMLVLAVTGGLVAATRLFSLYDLVETNYGLRLGIKLAWVGGVLGLAAMNRFLLVPRLQAGQAGKAAVREALRIGLVAEAAVGLGILFFAGVLATTPPPLGPADRYVVYLDEYRFQPAELVVRAGRVARVVVINRDDEVHDWTVPEMPYVGGAVSGGVAHDHGEGMVHVHLEPGGRAAVEFIPLRPGRYRLLCTVWPHAERGMVGWVVVRD